jgi:hypothetical protein
VVGQVAALSLMAADVVDGQIHPESDRAPTVLRR